MNRLIIVLLGTACFSGCLATQPPAISDIRHDVVKVQYAPIKNPADLQLVRAEAERGCELYQRKVSNHISKRCVLTEREPFLGTQYCAREEHLFACTP